MKLTEKIIQEHYAKAIFWLKPNGEDFCKGRLKEFDTYTCMKSSLMLSRRYPIDCKYLGTNYDFPDLSKCNYHCKDRK